MSGASVNVSDENHLAQFIGERGPHCLIVARHGETDWNAEGRMQGQRDTPLNKRGQSQAELTARFLMNIPLVQVHCSTLKRCRNTALPIAEVNTRRPNIIHSDFLREINLGVLEGELKNRQSTAELTRHYQDFSRDEINYAIPNGENLQDVSSRVQNFFGIHSQLLQGRGNYLIMGHRNVNKMILKSLLGLSLEEGCRIEHEHQRLYFYFNAPRELWSCRMEGKTTRFKKEYATIVGDRYA